MRKGIPSGKDERRGMKGPRRWDAAAKVGGGTKMGSERQGRVREGRKRDKNMM